MSTNLGVTALYTAATWFWGKLPGASLLMSREAARVFAVTNGILRLARVFGTQAPSLPCGLLQRHVWIDAEIRASGAAQIIELAAGLSRRGVCFSADPGLAYCDVDRAAVLAQKRVLLARTPEGRKVLQRPNFRLLAADLMTADFAAFPVQPGVPLAVIAEGLFVYLTAADQQRLCEGVRQLLARAGGGRFLFDFVPWPEQPRRTRLSRFLDWVLARATRSDGFARDARTRADLTRMLLSAGFTRVDAVEPRQAPAAWQLPFLGTDTQQLVFIAFA